MISRRGNKLARRLVPCYLVLAAAALMLLWGGVAEAGTFTNVSDTVTDPSPGASTTHQLTFTAATTASIEFVTFSFPSGFNVGSATLNMTSGIGAGTLSAPTSTSLCYTISSPASITTGTVLSFQLASVINAGTTGTKSITLTTLNTNATSCSSNKPNQKADTGTASIVIGNATAISATTQRVFVFTISAGTMNLDLDPVVNRDMTGTLTLTVRTNTSASSGGYVVTASTSQDLTGTAYSSATIPAWTGTTASPTTWDSVANPNYWGITRSAFPNDNGSYFGLTTTPQVVMSGNGPTNGDAQTQTWRVAIDFTAPADTYTTTVYFVGSPSF